MFPCKWSFYLTLFSIMKWVWITHYAKWLLLFQYCCNAFIFQNCNIYKIYFLLKENYRLNINWFVWIGNNQNISLLIWVVSNISYIFEFSTACIINSWNCSRKTHSTCLHSRAMCLWLWNCNLQNGSEFIDLQHLQNAFSIYRF